MILCTVICTGCYVLGCGFAAGLFSDSVLCVCVCVCACVHACVRALLCEGYL